MKYLQLCGPAPRGLAALSAFAAFLMAAPPAALAAAPSAPPVPPVVVPVAAIAKAALPAVVDIESIEPMPSPGGKSDQGGAGPDTEPTGSEHNAGRQAEAPKTEPPKGGESTSGSLIEPPRAQQALGTGFLIDARGDIVTNHHVIAKAKEIRVTMKDGSVYRATVVGVDKQADLAVLRIHAGHSLPHLEFGRSRRLELGDPVVAIGNPFGLGFSVSSGVVSALHRDIDSGPFDDFIQTDAAINRGNSGGPMLDAAGKVVGVDTAIYSPSGGSVGIGFAIPSSMVKPVAEQLIAHGRMERGWAGVDIEHVSDAMRHAWHLKTDDGAVVAGVARDGPAAGKLRPGEIIRSVNGIAISDTHMLEVAIAEVPVGLQARLDLWDRGKQATATITIATPPARSPVTRTIARPPPMPSRIAALGIRVLRHPGGAGLAVVHVEPGGVGARAGLTTDMLIEAVGPDFVASPRDLDHALERRHDVLLLVEGEAGPSWLQVRLAASAAAPAGQKQDEPEQKRG